MPETVQPVSRERPFAERRLDLPGGAVAITAAPAAARFVLRCDPGLAGRASGLFGAPIPTSPCTAGASGDRAALWLGPDEWLLLAEEGAQARIEAVFATLAREAPLSLVDVSHRSLAMEIAGAAAADILSADCPLDLDLARFGPGACTRTLFGKCEIVLWRRDAATFRLEHGRSYADYVWRLLEAACTDTACLNGLR